MKLSNPWPTDRSINTRSPYGWRVHPISKKKKFHNGVDVAGSYPVTVAGDGVVKKIGWSPRGGGHTVLIDHGEIVTVYYHGAHATALKKGQRVQTGDFIYQTGTTGASTGNHLHFEVRKRGGRWGNTLDPVPFLTGAPATTPNVLPVTGRFNRATWTAWQTALHEGGYKPGRIDGRPGRMTYSAIQRWAGATVDGRVGPQTRRAVQERLGVKPDGVWGRLTISELQRRLNKGSI
jgi:peptidoglycan hydrolase-like protein with peptidoglycan-binding domain